MDNENIKQSARELIDYLNASPTPFQSVEELEKLLIGAGAQKLSETENWNVEKGKLYYFIKSGTQLAAFRLSTEPKEDGFRVGIAHHDSPGFRIKSVPSKRDLGYERLLLEPYGGLIHHVWLDRPLSVAGRVFIRSESGAVYKNISVNKPVCLIPSAAVHVVRDVNSGAKFNPQTELLPFFSQDLQNDRGEVKFKEFIASELGTTADAIIDYELSVQEYFPSCFAGLNDEFISSPRLDDAAMSYSMIKGLVSSSGGNDISVVFDHEEIGSTSDRGARSQTVNEIVDRLCEKLGYTTEEKYMSLSRSVAFSADMAHATHPAYQDKSEPSLPVILNKGPVLKVAARQSYATSPFGTAYFVSLCEENGIPYQIFNNRSDAPGGGTIGPIISSACGIPAVDIGNPMLAMHSVREFAGRDDVYHMNRLFAAFFGDKYK